VATVEQTMMKVQRILTGPMGLRVMLDGDRFSVTFKDASTSVVIRVMDGGKDREGEPRTYVVVTSTILREVKPSAELFEWVARQGGSKWFGHVEVHDEAQTGTVYLMMSHTLLGDYLDEKELEAAMWVVFSSADSWDDELQKRFGGKRWMDP
jgi:hypothetical protein